MKFTRYSSGFPFLVANLNSSGLPTAYNRPFLFIDSTPHNLVVKTAGVNILLDSCYLPKNGNMVIDCSKDATQNTLNRVATVRMLNCYDDWTTKTLIHGARIVDAGEPSLATLNGKRYVMTIDEDGTTKTEQTAALYLPLDLFFDTDESPSVVSLKRFTPISSHIGRQVVESSEDGWPWPAEVGSEAQQVDITVDSPGPGKWTVTINGREYSYTALDYTGLSAIDIAAGLAVVIGSSAPAVHVNHTTYTNTINVFAVEAGAPISLCLDPPPTTGSPTASWSTVEQTANLEAALFLAGTISPPPNPPELKASIQIGSFVRDPADQGVVYASTVPLIHQAQSAAVAQISIDDFVFECVFKTPQDYSQDYIIAEKRDYDWVSSPSSSPGWSFRCVAKITSPVSTGLYPEFAIFDQSGPEDANTSNDVLVPNTWYHYMVFCDRSESNLAYYMRAYLNGDRLDSTVATRVVGTNSMENGGLLTLGGTSDLTGSPDSGVAMARVWTADDMFVDATSKLDEWDAVAEARYKILVRTW